MARYEGLIVLTILIIQSEAAIRHGFGPQLLHADKDAPLRAPQIIEPEAFSALLHHGRTKRGLKEPSADLPLPVKNESAASLPNDKLSQANSVPSPDASNANNLTQQVHNNITTMVSVESFELSTGAPL